MAVILTTLVPLLLLHLWLACRSRRALRFQLAVDILLLVVTGPAILRGLDLNPVRMLERIPPYGNWEWSQQTDLQPVQSDVVLQFHPWWEAVRRRLLRGEFPGLEPDIGAGVPLFGNGQCGLAAPQMVAVWALGPEAGTTVMALWKIECAAFGAFLLFAAGLRVRSPGPEVGGVLWAGSPYLIGWLLVPLAWVVALLPWLWWLGLLVVRRRARWPSVVGVGVAWGWTLGSGLHPETAVAVVGSAIVWAVLLHPRRALRPIAAGLIAGVVAVALAWPTLTLIAVSSNLHDARSTHPNAAPLPGGLRGAAVCQLLLPPSQGNPAFGDWSPGYPQPVGALGIGTAGLMILGVAGWGWRRRRVLLGALVVLVGASALALRIFPLDWLLVHVPPISWMTLPRFGVLIPWVLTLTAAVGLEKMTGGRSATARGILILVGLGVLAAMAWPGLAAGSRWVVLASLSAGVAVMVLLRTASRMVNWVVAVELAVLAVGINPTAARTDRLPRPPVLERLILLEKTAPGRVIGLDGVFPPNLSVRYGLGDLRSYDPLRPWPLARLHAVLGTGNPVLAVTLHRAPPRLLGAWSVRWVVSPRGRELPGWEAVDAGDGVQVWRNPQWRPEVRLATAVSAPSKEEDGWKLLAADSPILPDGVVVPPGSGVDVSVPGDLEVTARDPERIAAVVVSDGLQMLTVARCWLPGWTARIDGRPASVVRANLAGLGVVVPPGRHAVEFVYRPWSTAGLR